jgi:hypothetical protein
MSKRPPPRGFVEHELGLLVPAGQAAGTTQPLNAGVYATYRELTGVAIRQEDIVDRLGKLSAADCLWALAHASTRLFAAKTPDEHAHVQRQLVQELVGEADLGRALLDRLDHGRATVAFNEQQLVHLARLVILHADRRPHDDFGSGRLADDWVSCLIGVCDLLDADLDIKDHDQRLSWEIRQCALNYAEDTLPVIAIHHEVYRVLWPMHENATSKQVADAFKRQTKMEIADYFTVGAAVLAHLILRGVKGDGLPGVKPAHYFSSAEIPASDWQPFFDLTARDLDDLADELRAETKQYGETTYSSLTFERHPLIEIEDGIFLPLSMGSLQRRITQGVFHVLSEAAEAEGKNRRYYSSNFGAVFQESVENTLRRAVGFERTPPSITADKEYGPSGARKRSSDVILGYDRHPMFVEVVSGPLRAATVTQGDLCSAKADAERLVIKKTEQLDRSITDFFTRKLVLPGIDLATTSRVWPVIVTSHEIPHMELIIADLEQWIREKEYLTDARIGRLAIISAEELFFCEGAMQKGKSLLALTRGWKSGPAAHLPFKNYLIEQGGGQAPGSDHFVQRFAEANSENERRMLGRT